MLLFLSLGSVQLSIASPQSECPSFEITSKFTFAYGNLEIVGAPATVGTVVVAKSPRGEVVGCFITTTAGKYGAMYIYGEDPSVNPPLPGMRAGEQVSFYANNSLAVAAPELIWQNDKDLHEIVLVSDAEPAPVASFSASPTAGLPPLTVQFTDLSTGNVTTWSWDFGDGGTSTDQHPSHLYTQVGVYSVTLTVSGPGGVDTRVKTGYISVFSGPPTADFSAQPISGTLPLEVSFTNLSTNSTLSLWSFGDDTSSDQNHPTHTYLSKGIYTVSLAVLGPGGSALKTKTNYITVYAPVQAAFTADKTFGYVPLTVQFTNQSTGDYTNILWDFGDSSTSTSTDPLHIYQQAGIYSVSLTVSGPGGSNTILMPDLITVYPLSYIYLPMIKR